MANTEIEEDLWRIQKYTVGGLRNIATTETKPRERLLEHILIRMYTCKCMKMEICWLAFLMYKYRLDDGFEVSTGFRSPRKPKF